MEQIGYFSTLYQTSMVFTTLDMRSIGNIVGNGETAGIKHFLLFPHFFFPIKDRYRHFLGLLNCRLLTFSILSGLFSPCVCVCVGGGGRGGERVNEHMIYHMCSLVLFLFMDTFIWKRGNVTV